MAPVFSKIKQKKINSMCFWTPKYICWQYILNLFGSFIKISACLYFTANSRRVKNQTSVFKFFSFLHCHPTKDHKDLYHYRLLYWWGNWGIKWCGLSWPTLYVVPEMGMLCGSLCFVSARILLRCIQR